MPRPLGWTRARMGVRAVSALSAAVVVALALLVAGAALVFLVQHALRQQVQAEAEQQAQLITARLADNAEEDSNENAREAVRLLTQESADLAQVIVEYGADDGDPTRTIEAGTDPVGRDVAISDLWPDVGDTVVQSGVPVRTVDGTVVNSVLVASATESGDEPRHVVLLYAAPLTSVDVATNTVIFYLLWGVPLLIVIAGATTYLFSGRALRPVEAMRSQVAAMTEKDLGQRVPVPPARDEIGRLAETMNGMLARLQDAQGVQRRFVADASHELRSPLATIATGLELMQNGTVDRSTITALRGETSRLKKLVEGLILLARADERGLQPRREEVDLDEVVDQERGRPADGAVVAEVRSTPVRVVGDRGQLARVVRNLVDNARRHARSKVLVTAGREGDTAVLEVADDGPGVPPADRARVFERFVRLDDARARSDGGSGLGLAIVAEVVAAHGGSVEVTDAPGGGARFRVRMPAAAAPGAHPADALAGPEEESRPLDGRPAKALGPADVERPVAAAPLPKPASAAGSARSGEAVRPAGLVRPGEAVRFGESAQPGELFRPREAVRPGDAVRSGGAAVGGDAAWTGEAAWAGDAAWTGEAAWTGDAARTGKAAPAGGRRAAPGRDPRPSPTPGPDRRTDPPTPGWPTRSADPDRSGGPSQRGEPPAEAEPARDAEPVPHRPAPGSRQVPQPRGARPETLPTTIPMPVERRPVRDEEARRDPVTAPRGIPVVAPEERKPAPAPRPQPGSAMR